MAAGSHSLTAMLRSLMGCISPTAQVSLLLSYMKGVAHVPQLRMTK